MCCKVRIQLCSSTCCCITPFIGHWAPQVALVVKNLPVNAKDIMTQGSLWVRKIPWGRAWQPTPVFLPGESHRQRPGGLQSLGSQKVIYNWSTLASKHLKRLSFPYCILGLTINWPFMHGFTSGHSILFHWFMCLLFFVCLFVLFCFMPMLYYFGYCSFVIWFEFKACNASMFVLLSQVCCGYLGIFMVPNKF